MAQTAARPRTTQKKKAPSLAERIARLEDIEAIRTITASVNWCVDHQQLDVMLEHFTNDIVYDIGDFGTYRGKAELRGFLLQMPASFGMVLHRASNQVIEVDGNSARSRTYYETNLESQGQSLVGAGEYHDQLVKRAGVWQIRARKAVFTYLVPLNEGWAKQRFANLAPEK